MARIRTIKPQLWTKEKIGKLSFGARLLFIGSFNFADDYGFIQANPLLLKSLIFPYDETLRLVDIKDWISELCNKKLFVKYSHNEDEYFIIRNFLKHQIIDKRYETSFIGKEIAKDVLAKIKTNT